MARNMIMKVCLLGDGEVGKTSLIRKFVYDEFDDRYLMTIGNKITKKKMAVDIDGQVTNLTLMMNDIVGQVEFERVHRQYYRGSKAGIFVCDLTRKKTLENMDWWMGSFRRVAGDVPVIILANKSDLASRRQVTEQDIAAFCAKYSCEHFLTSAKTGENVETAFERMGRTLCRDLK